ncbi:hypothetical protein CAK95_07225 [Pseudorhodoplanes sinuspersici]|uniref:HTH araC/xylS-type domain-containing protein n=1 Tax=Pseudorhodoplanes sinuspersici TaxID=1235591 RepID=A0A1W6ZZK9_9HYPH|nr:hypothetical protein CAK95_07225 [Pseudorhodoplanes sinuspersici]
MGRLVGPPPLLAPDSMPDGVRLTRRWRHEAMKGALPALSDHVLATYYSAPRDLHWRSGENRIVARAQIDSISIIPQDHDGRWDIAGPIEVSHIFLTDARLQSCADGIANGKEVRLIDRAGFADPVAAGLMRMLSRESSPDIQSSRLFLDHAIDLLCVQLIRSHSSVSALATTTKRRGLADWQVKRVTDFMRERLDQDISLGELAGLVNLSRHHFCTSFRLATGQTPHERFMHLRIDRAREMLAASSASITEIALDVGYETPSAFTASFRKITAMTPSDYRREFSRSLAA